MWISGPAMGHGTRASALSTHGPLAYPQGWVLPACIQVSVLMAFLKDKGECDQQPARTRSHWFQGASAVGDELLCAPCDGLCREAAGQGNTGGAQSAAPPARGRPGSFCRLRAAAPGWGLDGEASGQPQEDTERQSHGSGQVPALSGVNTLCSPQGCPGSAGAVAFLAFHTKPWHCSAKPWSYLAAPVLSWAGCQPCSPHPEVLSSAPGSPPEPSSSLHGEGQQLDVGSGVGRAVCWTPGLEKEAPSRLGGQAPLCAAGQEMSTSVHITTWMLEMPIG